MSKQFHDIYTHLWRDLSWGSHTLKRRRRLPNLAKGNNILSQTVEGRSRSMGNYVVDSIDVAIVAKHGLYEVLIVVVEWHVLTLISELTRRLLGVSILLKS
jgi:hypothetical protein